MLTTHIEYQYTDVNLLASRFTE
ncbi:plasmid segregation protein ParM [Escherichia coli]|nr:plasmid segregation protein ParM [Escherichia coli]